MQPPERKGRWKDHPAPVTLTCIICGDPFTVPYYRRNKAKYCDYQCHQVGEGRKGGATTGAQRRRTASGKSYPKQNGRHIHRTVAERMLGRPLKPRERVHHKDENKQNFAETNLEVLPSQGEHMAKHRREMLASRKLKHGY